MNNAIQEFHHYPTILLGLSLRHEISVSWEGIQQIRAVAKFTVLVAKPIELIGSGSIFIRHGNWG